MVRAVVTTYLGSVFDKKVSNLNVAVVASLMQWCPSSIVLHVKIIINVERYQSAVSTSHD